MSLDNTFGDPSGPISLEVEPSSSRLEPLSCVACRVRKLKCNRVRPVCGRCEARPSLECIYPNSRRRPVLRRRKVKELEERLAQVEGLLHKAEQLSTTTTPPDDACHDPYFDALGLEVGQLPSDNSPITLPLHTLRSPDPRLIEPMTGPLIKLGIYEALPPQDLIEELHAIYFQQFHVFRPIVHPGRYLQAFYSGAHLKPPMSLQYAIWALAAHGHEKYNSLHHAFYIRARRYIETEETKGKGEGFVTIANAQALILLADDEARSEMFARAILTVAKALRLTYMLSLHALDEDYIPFIPTVPPPCSWLELEERRRVFWGAYIIDSLSSTVSGWPCLTDTTRISTRLPSSEQAFLEGTAEAAPSLSEAFRGMPYSPSGLSIMTHNIFNQLLKHVHRPNPEDSADNADLGEFWQRHRYFDNLVSTVFMFLPDRCRLPRNAHDANAVQGNLDLHASIICLHRAAIDKVFECGLDHQLACASMARVRTAAEEIVRIIRLPRAVPERFRCPLSTVSLYCAVSVYLHEAAANPYEPRLSVADTHNLQTLIESMKVAFRSPCVNGTFLHQVALDIDALGIAHFDQIPDLSKYRPVASSPSLYCGTPLLPLRVGRPIPYVSPAAAAAAVVSLPLRTEIPAVPILG